MLRFGCFSTLLAVVTVLGFFPAGAAAGGQVSVSLTEFSISPSSSSAEEGTITFSVNNSGTLAHNFRVISTSLAPDALPVDSGVVDESAVTVVASTSADLLGGASENVVADLAVGSYVLICNVPGHYLAGMHVAFTVTAAAAPTATAEAPPSPAETPSTVAPTVALPSTGVDAQGSPSTPWLPMIALGAAGALLAALGLVCRRRTT